MAGRIVVEPLDIMAQTWSFRDSAPTWSNGRYFGSATFDPFPAYPHDLELVTKIAEQVADCWAPSWDVDLKVANREEVGRSNGYSNASDNGEYVDGEWVKLPPRGLIVLCGKRIPPHPAVTRYLVAHEYGHNVHYMLNARGGLALHSDELLANYARIRGLDESAVHHASGGRWHDAAGEIFADDFRLLITGIEADYWPHPGVPHPFGVRAIQRWWHEAAAANPNPREETTP